MSSINLNTCDGICHNCVKRYIQKHKPEQGEKFEIPCAGIPLQYIPDSVLSSLGPDPEAAVAMVDPVTWAAKFLDWHCIDPDGKHWIRKSLEGTNGAAPKFDPTSPENVLQAKNGLSPFHRPYQREMLRCSSKRKIFRLGRQNGKTETLVISILFHIFTHEEFTAEVIAPYQSQIDLIFTRITNLIDTSATLVNSVERSVKAPHYQIKLKNKSSVVGFTAGTRSGQEAGASRGQHANMLVFDEADYLNPKDIDSALAVIINHPDATVWMSSTPTGKREKFYEACNSREYREFHFPSHVNPNWTDAIDKYFRSQYTQDGYVHEILAEFGSQTEGVYQIKYVEEAQENYSYSDMKPTQGWTYMIGVDWNDMKIGTTIAVVGWDPVSSLFYLVDKEIVSRNERTQLTACNKIAEMNRLWRPDFIYVDKGYGSTQIEVLHDFGAQSMARDGVNSPDARLRTIVKPFDFGGTIEVRDIFTHQMVKKPAKPFLVENSVRRFETGSFKFPKTDKDFTAQLLGYIVSRVSVSGRPVYEAQNDKDGDHFLDAVNLAFVAFTMEKSKFGKPSYESSISFAGRFGENKERPVDSKGKPTPGKESFKKTAQEHKPQPGRSSVSNDTRILGNSFGEIPGANMASNSSKLWDWPGFGHDAPRPVTRTLDEAVKQANQRTLRAPSMRHRPKRAKF